MKGIIFDMDGTLVDNISYHKKAWFSFLKNHNIQIDEKDFNAQNHGTIDEMIIRFFGTGLPANKIEELGQEKEDLYRNSYQSHIREIEGLSNCLLNLQNENISIGLATMGDLRNINFTLTLLGLNKFFHSITGGHEVSKGKPSPEIYLKTVNKLGIDAETCIAVEDSMGGIASAVEAGLKVIGITTTHSKQELLDNGCYLTVDNYIDFDKLFK